MAGYEQSESINSNAGPGQQKLIAWAGAVTSVAVLVGLGLWGYELTVRDVSGVPIVRSQDGPGRIAPDNPGGSRMGHQGLAVNNVAAVGAAADPADRLLLAPRPIDLQADDAAAVAASAPPPNPSDTGDETELAAAPAAGAAIAAPAPINTDQPDTDTAARAAEPVAQPAAAIATVTTTPAIPATIPASVPGLRRSLRPMPRPNVDLAARAAAVAAAAATAQTAAEQPEGDELASVPAGSNLVQLGAFDSAEVARAEWTRLSGRFESLLVDKQRLVQSAVRGGRTFYRLRAVGFDDISAARRFCAALTAEKALCVPVVAR